MKWLVVTVLLILGAFAGAVVIGTVMMRVVTGGVKKELDQRADALRAIAVTEIKELVPGTWVRVLGTAIGETAPSPHSGRPCILYDASMKALGGGYRNYAPEKSVDAKRIVPFTVDDETGRIEVDVAYVKLELASHMLEMEGEKPTGFGDSVLVREMQSNQRPTIEHWEHRLEPDHPVAVIGMVERTDTGLRLVGTAERPLVISNVKAAFE